MRCSQYRRVSVSSCRVRSVVTRCPASRGTRRVFDAVRENVGNGLNPVECVGRKLLLVCFETWRPLRVYVPPVRSVRLHRGRLGKILPNLQKAASSRPAKRRHQDAPDTHLRRLAPAQHVDDSERETGKRRSRSCGLRPAGGEEKKKKEGRETRQRERSGHRSLAAASSSSDALRLTRALPRNPTASVR
ncbi:hypothetical protein PUN28_013449 [Cardiocondyla obscurior]|uniref:Uncharacterized protein n=1 Tax=Cardiocondyla obscurior TaxID=286306 RepID=A0AAW2F3T2_9HYME